MYMARRTRKTRRKRYSPSPRRSRTKTKTKTPTPPKPAGRRVRRRRRTALARATRRHGGVGNQGQIAAVRQGLTHVKTREGNRAHQLPRDPVTGREMSMQEWHNKYAWFQPKKGGRRRRNRRRRTRRQRGGCEDCPLNMQANLYASLDPVLPPGGGYQPGGRNGLNGGYYYNLNCPNGTCHPVSTTGNMWPGYDRQIEKWAQKKFSGGRRRRRRRRRRKSRRRRRKRRRNTRRINQRGGQGVPGPSPSPGPDNGGGDAGGGDNDDADEGTPVGPGVGASIKTPPIRQAMGRLVTGIRNITPGPIVGVARSAASKLGNLQHAYYGEESAASPDVMDQPRMQANIPSDALDNLSRAKPQQGGSEGLEDGPEGEGDAKEAAMKASGDPAL